MANIILYFGLVELLVLVRTNYTAVIRQNKKDNYFLIILIALAEKGKTTTYYS